MAITEKEIIDTWFPNGLPTGDEKVLMAWAGISLKLATIPFEQNYFSFINWKQTAQDARRGAQDITVRVCTWERISAARPWVCRGTRAKQIKAGRPAGQQKPSCTLPRLGWDKNLNYKEVFINVRS